MSYENMAIIIGNVGADPEIKYLPNGDAVCNFSVATSKHWKDKQTGEKKKATEWHRIVGFRQTAEFVGQYVRKGMKVYVNGEIRTRKWEAQDGSDRYTTEIHTNSVRLMDPPPQQSQDGNSGHQDSQGNPVPKDADVFDDDIPF